MRQQQWRGHLDRLHGFLSTLNFPGKPHYADFPSEGIHDGGYILIICRAATLPIRLTALSPSKDGRALLTIEDIRCALHASYHFCPGFVQLSVCMLCWVH